jgi:prolyl-tRNA synthetase
MKQSKLFSRAIKDLPKDEDSYNAQYLIRAGFIDKLGAGIYNLLPLGKIVMDKISQIIREEMNSVDGQELLMSALSPKEVWQKTNRWDNFDALFKLKASDSRDYALGATHEEIVVPILKKYLNSYKDLPLSVYQIQTKFRNEKRAKAGLIRGREFLMKDMYSFHKNDEDLNKYYEIVKKSYFNIFKKLNLDKNTYLTYSSGGDFSEFSHEFQTICPSGEDLIYICTACQVAINQEIIESQKICPICKASDFKQEKAIEVGNIFKLGTRFSEPFKLKYSDEKGNLMPVIMGCYGMGISRLLATIVEVSHDDKGVIWPDLIAPFKVHLISIDLNNEAEKLYHKLKALNIQVLYDDRDISAGVKFAEADLISCPYRLVLSEKTQEKGLIELKIRKSQSVKLISQEELIKRLK